MSLSGLAPFDRRGHQRRLIVDCLRRAGRASRAEVAEQAELSPQVVTLIVQELIADGIVVEAGRRSASRGQPPIDLTLNPEGGFAIGLQIERGGVTGVVADLEARVRSQARVFCRTEAPEAAIGTVTRLVEMLLAEARIDRARIWGAGLALPGPFGVPADGSDPLAMPAWSGKDFVPDYAAALGMPVIVGNDATAAAIGEHLNGAARDLRSFVYIYVAEGLGGGLFVDGNPVAGAFGNAGEIGRMLVPDHRAVSGIAPLEAIASISALRTLLAANGLSIGQDAQPEILLKRAPAVTEEWFQRACGALRVAIANLENMLDPEAIVLGGQLPGPVLKRMAADAAPLLPSISDRDGRARPRLIIGDAGRTSPALGGASLPLFRALSPQPRASRPAAGAAALRAEVLQ